MKKLLIICSSSFYSKIENIDKALNKDFELVMPNCYLDNVTNESYENMSEPEYISFFKSMYLESREKINKVDCCLVLNFDKEKNGTIYKNYIGASTFLEMYEAFMHGKEIYIFNELDKSSMLYDEIRGFNPIILKGDLEKISK